MTDVQVEVEEVEDEVAVVNKAKEQADNKNKKGLQIGLQELLVLVLLPAFSYIVTYNYEVGYASKMGIPLAFVEADKSSLFTVLLYALYLAIFVFISVIFVAMIAWVCTRKSEKWAFRFAMVAYVLLVGLVLSWLHYVENGVNGLKYLAIGYIPITVVVLLVMQRTSKKKNIEETEDDPISSRSILFLVLAGAFVVILYSKNAGMCEAIVSRSYHQLTYQGQSYLLLRSYGDKVVLGRYQNNFLTGDVLLISQNDLKNVTIHPYHGPAPTIKTQTNP